MSFIALFKKQCLLACSLAISSVLVCSGREHETRNTKHVFRGGRLTDGWDVSQGPRKRKALTENYLIKLEKRKTTTTTTTTTTTYRAS